MYNKEMVAKFLKATKSKIGTVHENFFLSYETAKSTMLAPLFNGTTTIEKEIKIQKSVATIRNEMDENSFRFSVLSKIHSTLRKKYDIQGVVLLSEHLSTEDTETIAGVMSLSVLAQQILPYNIKFTSLTTDKPVKFQAGTKISKIFRHLMAGSDLEEIISEYSQYFNQKFITGTLCLSIDIMDYLTTSVNSYGWTSCFNTVEGGAYCASTLSLITSPNTMIAYLKGQQDCFSAPKVHFSNKKWRTYVSFNESMTGFHIGQGYPYQNDELTFAVADMVEELTKKSYPDRRVRDYVFNIVAPQNFYNDAEYDVFYSCLSEEFESDRRINISTIGSICPVCGKPFNDSDKVLKCGTCC